MAKTPAYNDQNWSSEEQVTSTKLDAMADNSYFNKKYKVGTPPDADEGIVIARGKKQMTGSGGVALATARITFATDSLDGDPNFSEVPVIQVTLVQDTGSTIRLVDKYNINDLTANYFDVQFEIATSTSDTWYCHWLAMGPGDEE